MRTPPALLAVITGVLLLAGCEAADFAGVSAPGEKVRADLNASNSLSNANAQLAAIHELQSAFHGALHDSDYEAILALWTDDATLQVGPTSATGPQEIAEFFRSSPPFKNGWAALAPTYNTRIEVDGNRAEFGFECVYVAEPPSGVLTGNPVTAHLHATGFMRKVGDRWLFESFVGGAGPLP